MSSIKAKIITKLLRPARKNFPHRHVELGSLSDLAQIELIDLQKFAKSNKGMKWISVVINALSKFGYAEPLPNKQGPTVAAAMDKILSRSRERFDNVQSDFGTEFYCAPFKKIMQKYNINHYSSFSTKKSSIAERWVKTIKQALFKNFQLQGSYEWVSQLQRIVDEYNNKVHSSIGMKPAAVSKKHECMLLKKIAANGYIRRSKIRFKLGDTVRVSKYKQIFDKSYYPNWNTEIFIISKIRRSNPPVFYLNDLANEHVLGGFYGPELQKTKLKDDYLIEKVLKRTGNRIYVKWLGFAKPSWPSATAN